MVYDFIILRGKNDYTDEDIPIKNGYIKFSIDKTNSEISKDDNIIKCKFTLYSNEEIYITIANKIHEIKKYTSPIACKFENIETIHMYPYPKSLPQTINCERPCFRICVYDSYNSYQFHTTLFQTNRVLPYNKNTGHKYCDCSITTSDCYTIESHKLILESWFSQFEKFFEAEADPRSLDFHSISVDYPLSIIQPMIDIIYANKNTSDVSNNVLLSILQFSDA